MDIDPLVAVVLVVIAWSSLGLLACLWFRRQGHNFMLFAGLAIWMGPLVLLLMRSVTQQQDRPIRVVKGGTPGGGWIDVLVGIDGSTQSMASARAALTMLGASIRRLRVVSVLDPETANSPGGFDNDDSLEATLAAAPEALGVSGAEVAFVSGRADLALVEHAVDEGFPLLVVAHRHHTIMSRILGSTVDRLARNASVSVLIGPPVEGEH